MGVSLNIHELLERGGGRVCAIVMMLAVEKGAFVWKWWESEPQQEILD